MHRQLKEQAGKIAVVSDSNENIRHIIMLTKKDLLLISPKYFMILKKTNFYIEVLSKNTGHCWMIYKHGSPDKYPVWIYHKHKQPDQCYHLHKRTGSVELAVQEILQHDKYTLSGRKNVFQNQKYGTIEA